MRKPGNTPKISLPSFASSGNSSSGETSSTKDSTNSANPFLVSQDYTFTLNNSKSANDSVDQHGSTSTSTSSQPDYFHSSNAGTDSPLSLSRSSSTTSDHHPWANLFPEGAAGAITSKPRTEQSYANSTMSNVSMSASSSSCGTAFKMPPTIHRMKSGGSNVSSTNGSVLNASDQAKYRPIEALELAHILSASSSSSSLTTSLHNSSTLIIDIRPSTSFAVARIRGSINLCAPSTLLKRSGVTVERIEEEMLHSEQDQIQFSAWKSGPQKDGITPTEAENGCSPIQRIVVLDTDTISTSEAGKPSAGGGGPCLIGLLRKFDLAGFAGQLLWLVGGFNNFSSQIGSSSNAEGGISSQSAALVDYTPLKYGDNKTTLSNKGLVPSLKRTESQQRRSSAPPNQVGLFNIRPGFSTGHSRHSLVQPRGLPMEAFSHSSTTRRSSLGGDQGDRRGMQISTSHPTFDIDGQPATGELGGSACANPFFDNIRQNRELQHGITERIPLDLPAIMPGDLDLLPRFLQRLVEMEEKERTELLAKKFFDIEKAEQRRLIATMQQHASESNLSPGTEDIKGRERLSRRQSGSTDALHLSSIFSSVSVGQNCDNSSKETFPFSIAAALERGSENRYNNIWTYEHSRIRCAIASDYLNGSYIEPGRAFGCKRRYIATQAPLPSTFETFWNVIWLQNVRTICMITREFESGRVQSHNYWKESRYGGLSLQVLEETSLDAKGREVQGGEQVKDQTNEGGNFFPSTDSTKGETTLSSPCTIRRRLALSDGKDKREIIQLQFVAWPDFSIPEEAEDILNYISMANKEQHRAEVELRNEDSKVGPLVVHCSAGVGRTGTYIAIDSVLDVLRKARREKRQIETTDVWDDSLALTAHTTTSIDQANQKDVQMINVKNTSSLPQTISQPRRSLKRELSPSAMDIDTTDGSQSSSSPVPHNFNGTVRQYTNSPPPLRRGRSSEKEELPTLSLSSLGSGSGSSFSGLDTPSGAMDSMNITWESPQQPSSKSKTIKSSHLNGELESMSPSSKRATFASILDDASKISNSERQVDLIQHTVETIREQRMSTVQTGRQYVFAYRAVIEGLLREGRMEKLSNTSI